jgi:hypothetical protein
VKGQYNFLTEYFLTCSWRFSDLHNRLEQLEFKFEKKKWDLKTYRKNEKKVPAQNY